MIKKKNIDIGQILRRSSYEAKVKHGIVQNLHEANVGDKPKYVYKEFDPEEALKKIQLKPKKWGKKGTFEANHLDILLSNLGVAGGDGLASVRTMLQTLNRVLGVQVGEYGLPVFSEDKEEAASLTEIVSSLQIKDILHSIIYEQEASAAGTILEGMMARVVSGEQSSIVKRPIQDVVDGSGNYISLKVLDDSSEFKGSKLNLAKGIAEKGSITYLLFVKNTKDDPFMIKTHSFKINKDNYFPFMLNRYASELTAGHVYQAVQDLLGEKFSPGDEMLKGIAGGEKLTSKSVEKEKEAEVNFDEVAPELIDQAIKNIAATKDIQTDFRKGFHVELANVYKQLLDKLKIRDTESGESQEDFNAGLSYVKNYFPTLDPDNQDNILKSIPGSTTGKKPLFTKIFQKAIEEVKKLGSASSLDKIEYFETNPQKKKIVEKYKQNRDSLSEQESKILSDMMTDNEIYQKRFRITYKKLQNIVTFFSKLQKEVRNILQTAEQQSGAVRQYGYSGGEIEKIKNISEYFFKTVKEIDPYSPPAGIKTDTQFKHKSLSSMFAIARSFKDAEYDNSYPEFVLEKKWLFTSKQDNVKTLRELVTPIYEGAHKIDSGAEQYFVYDDIEGLELIKKGAEQSSSAALKQQTEFAGMKPSQIKQPMKENKNTHSRLTKSWSRSILNELLNNTEET